MKFAKIELFDLYETMEDVPREKIENKASKLVTDTKGSVENTSDDVIDALEVYFSLDRVVERHHKLTKLTIRCFNLVTDPETTGCFALSLLNNRGNISRV